MPVTPTYALPYQSLGDPPNGASLGADLANAVETELARIDAAAAANAVTVADLDDRPFGFIAQTNPVAITSCTTTETMHASVTGTLATGRRYRVSYQGQTQSSVAADLIMIRYRIATGASVTIAGTLLRTTAQHAAVAARNTPVAFDHVFTVASSGQWTVGISVVRNTGSGTVKLDYGAALVEPLLLLEDIGV